MALVLREELWRERRIRTGEIVKHERFVDFLTVAPLEGLGEDPALIKRLLSDHPATLAAFEAACVEGNQGTRTDLRNNVTEVRKSIRGNSQAYTLRRLKRQHPVLFRKVTSGELTANQAAIQAGFRKKLTRLEQVKHLFSLLSLDERIAFVTWWRAEWKKEL
jgi:ribosomal protein S20